ncbi:hypothetical protein B0T17DRAFT_82435 [Bombardia bombarda]|uniref:Secreted protein n=1 Tax=Bombardia bombarda TaxID=252184 RepID=A0AA40CF45_9PEZI|nr:hypothetical protein B0T17DRAFT_82435 [Bombardia bombarda]
MAGCRLFRSLMAHSGYAAAACCCCYCCLSVSAHWPRAVNLTRMELTLKDVSTGMESSEQGAPLNRLRDAWLFSGISTWALAADKVSEASIHLAKHGGDARSGECQAILLLLLSHLSNPLRLSASPDLSVHALLLEQCHLHLDAIWICRGWECE